MEAPNLLLTIEGSCGMIDKVIKYGEPFLLIFGTLGAYSIWYKVYEVMWDEYNFIVFAVGISFFSMTLDWWLDYFEKKKIQKVLDNW